MLRHRANLRLRFLAGNLVVAAITLLSVVLIARSYRAQSFPNRLRQLPHQNPSVESRDVAPDVINLHRQIDNESTALALGLSMGSVILLSWWMTHSINRPLREIERVVQQFNKGDLSARVTLSAIPELHRLGLTLNSVASRLQDVETRRQAVLSDLAHEMRTPLTSIRGWVELVGDQKVELTPEICDTLSAETLRLCRLLQDMQSLSAIEDGSVRLRLQACEPCALIERVGYLCQINGLPPNVSLELHCPAQELPRIFADPDRVEQILFNLVGNALSYTPSGRVTLRAWRTKLSVWIAVEDTGIGIAPEDLPHLFNRFWRSDQSRSLHQEGRGIGLSITRRLVEMQSGQIEVESVLGKGTQFRVCFPLAKE